MATTSPRTHFLLPKDATLGGKNERFEAIRPHVQGRTVLDVGGGWGSHRADWVHGRIAHVANRVVGIDLDPDKVNKARDLGYNFVQGDATNFSLDEQFDVVFAGELLEHLECFSGFLDAARRHLRQNGTLLITTPNAFGFMNFVYRIGGSPRVNADHTCWFCADTLRQLLERSGFAVEEIQYLRHTTPGRIRGVLARAVRRLLPERVAYNTMMVVAAPR